MVEKKGSKECDEAKEEMKCCDLRVEAGEQKLGCLVVRKEGSTDWRLCRGVKVKRRKSMNAKS